MKDATAVGFLEGEEGSPMSDIEEARAKADEARKAAVAADQAYSRGAPDRETALALHADMAACIAISAFYANALAELERT